MLNTDKTKSMIFNFTNNYQFTSRLQLKNQNIELLNDTKLLGTIISDDLKWNLNTKRIIKKANARMQLLREMTNFGASPEELKEFYISFVRSQLEQSATVWHSSLTEENSQDLERVQKTALKIILRNRYNGYKKSLRKLDLDSLDKRRENLCLNFAIKCTKNSKMKFMFPQNKKKHRMNTRDTPRYFVQHANKERLKKSAIIYMQNLLNENQILIENQNNDHEKI